MEEDKRICKDKVEIIIHLEEEVYVYNEMI